VDLQNGANARYYVLDARGHARAMVDSTGSATDYYEYDAWGNVLPGSYGSTPNLFKWNAAAGCQHVPFTGLYHVDAREYDPRTARWLQRDPIGQSSGDPNLYRYCGNDPVNLADPSGLQPPLPAIDSPRTPHGYLAQAMICWGQFSALTVQFGQHASIRATNAWTSAMENLATTRLHHVFPQMLREQFKGIGIHIDKYLLRVPDFFHKWLHSGENRGRMVE
ncbi:MAG: DUF2380 domain-containing protein, partial [Armatimonadetes bacterium]|nr:DUF2380 domain-containing protein [Armatimonadota bacterium]